MKIKLSILVVSACVLAACGSDDAPAPTTQPVVPKAQVAAADPTAKMARAVASGKGGAAVDLKYEISSKPEPGKPIEVDLALVPGTVADSLTVSVTPTPGLEVMDNAVGTFGALKIGEVAHHKITVRAQNADVVYLTVTATLNAVGINTVRTFAVPLIFTEPGSVAPTTASSAGKEAAAKPDATGQNVQPMKAVETK